jgi:plasmid stabilization system protein ParE
VPYAIRSTPRADADIDHYVAWLHLHVSLASAARWHAGISAKIRTLSNNPERCPLSDEASDLGIELREMYYGRRRHVYRILFTIDGQTVNVHRVRHAAQDRLFPGDI